MKKNLILIGMMGVGKSTLGQIVAKRLDLKFIDTDSNIEKKNSMKISEIFKKKGEKFFRILEEKEVLEAILKHQCVIALGGGSFMNKNIRDSVLKSSVSVWLDTSLKTLYKRIKWSKKRPLLHKGNTEEIIKKLHDERKNIYKLANHRIICDGLSKQSVVKKIINFYEKY